MVLLETMNNGIEVIAESQQQLQNDMKEVRTDARALKSDAGVLKNDMTDVKGELSEIKYKLDRKVTYEDFEKLEKRVLKLESVSTR